VNSKGKTKEEKQASSNNVTIREADDLEGKVELVGAPKKIFGREGFQHGPINGMFLEHYFL